MPEVPASPALSAEAPPEIRLIASRRRLASSKSSASEAASILFRSVSIVSVMPFKRANPCLGSARKEGWHARAMEIAG